MIIEIDMERGIPIKNIFFSVLIPVYNVEKYLGKCIYSVLEQTYDHFEIILINDGSTDGSGQICERYARLDDRIRMYHQSNQGLIMTRRNALAIARGDYYLFLDSDDYWDLDLLETINKVIEDYHCDMVIFNYKKVSPGSIELVKPVFENGSIFDTDNKELIFEEIIKGHNLNQIWAKAVKNNLVDYRDYSKYKKIKIGEDLLQSLPLLWNAKRILYIDKAMYNYRMNPTSITHSFNVNCFDDMTTVRGIVLKYMSILNMKDYKYLKLFYQNYVNNFLDCLSDLSCSDIPTVKKKDIMAQTQLISLYKNALVFIDQTEFSNKRKIQFHLFHKKYYGFLILFNKIIEFIKVLLRI